MLRRHLIALGGSIMVGAPVARVGELLGDLGELPPAPLPSRLTGAHVAQVRDLTRRLADAGRAYGANPEVDSAATTAATRLLNVSGPEPVKRALMTAVAERHMHAAWSAFDAGLHRHALYHCARALELATQAGDAYCQATALTYAGMVSVEAGHPDDGLKMLQCARVTGWDIPRNDDRRAAVEACVLMEFATALAMLGQSREADRYVGISRELWTPAPGSRSGDLDLGPALLQIERGRLDLAEQFAAASVHRWEGVSQRARTRSGIVLATIYVTAGEQQGLQLAHKAVTDVTRLTSVRVRKQLVPLVDALEARPGSNARELARLARQVAA